MNGDEVIWLSDEPYTRDDVFARSDTEEYIYTTELAAYVDSRYDLDECASDGT